MYYAIPKKEAWPMVMTTSETDLVRRIASGDEGALGQLYAVYGQRLYAYALRLAGDHALAEDAVQETLVAVWRMAGRYRGEGRVLAWLLGIVHNLALKAVRRQPLPLLAEMEATLPAPGDLPEELIQAATGHVWSLTTSGLDKLDHGLTVVSMLHLAEGTQYRLVGEAAADYPAAQPAQPGLEDGYVWLMKDAGQSIETA